MSLHCRHVLDDAKPGTGRMGPQLERVFHLVHAASAMPTVHAFHASPCGLLTTGAIDNRLNWTTRRSALTRGCRLVLEDGRTRCTPREERVRSGSDRGHLLRR